jgi:hypothetical protein
MYNLILIFTILGLGIAFVPQPSHWDKGGPLKGDALYWHNQKVQAKEVNLLNNLKKQKEEELRHPTHRAQQLDDGLQEMGEIPIEDLMKGMRGFL